MDRREGQAGANQMDKYEDAALAAQQWLHDRYGETEVLAVDLGEIELSSLIRFVDGLLHGD